MIVTTETGSVYEFRDGRVCRVMSNHVLRRDGDWLRMRVLVTPVVGESMALYLEPLGDGDTTVRVTSLVTSVELGA